MAPSGSVTGPPSGTLHASMALYSSTTLARTCAVSAAGASPSSPRPFAHSPVAGSTSISSPRESPAPVKFTTRSSPSAFSVVAGGGMMS